eukprot:6190986-Pleurochrysis_carterae.AAC.1
MRFRNALIHACAFRENALRESFIVCKFFTPCCCSRKDMVIPSAHAGQPCTDMDVMRRERGA